MIIDDLTIGDVVMYKHQHGNGLLSWWHVGRVVRWEPAGPVVKWITHEIDPEGWVRETILGNVHMPYVQKLSDEEVILLTLSSC